MSFPSNGENLVAIKQAGVIRNCVFDFNEVAWRKKNGSNALIDQGVTEAKTFNIHRGAPVFRRIALPNSIFTRIGGTIADKDLIPVQAAVNGAGSKAGGVKSVYDAYELVGFSLSNDVRMSEDNVQNSDSLAVQCHGVISVPHQGPKQIKMGQKVQWAVVSNFQAAQDNHRKITGRPQTSVFAHLEPYEPKILSALIAEFAPSDGDSATTNDEIAAKDLAALLNGTTALNTKSLKKAAILESQLRRSESKRVVGIALNNAVQGDILDLFLYPQNVFSDGLYPK